MSTFGRYGLAFLFLGIAFGARIALRPLIGDESPFVIFVPAVMAAAWLCGLLPAVAIAVGALLLAHCFFMHPDGDLTSIELQDVLAGIIFFSAAMFVAALTNELKRRNHAVHLKAVESDERADRLDAEIERRERVEQQLREREERLRLIFENARGIAIISLDLRGDIEDWNPGAETMFGYSMAEVIGRSGGIIFTEEDRKAGVPERELESARKDGCAPDERWHTTKAGKRIFLSGINCAKYNDRGELLGFLKVAREMTEHQRYQEAVRISEEKFRRIFNYSPTGIAQIDLAGRIVDVNAKYTEITGYSFDELRSRTVFDITHPDEVANDRLLLAKVSRGETSLYQVEKRYIHKDGHPVWVRVTAAWLRDSEGKPSTTISIVEDITERRHVEQLVRENEERLRLTTEAANVGTWIWDSATNAIKWSPILFQHLGLPADSPANLEVLLRHIHPDDRDRVRLYLEYCQRESVPCDIQYRVIWPDGSIHWIWAKGQSLIDVPSGKAVRYTGITMDVTERKNAEMAIRKRAELLNLAQVFIRDLDDRITNWYGGAEKMYGWRTDEAVGKVVHELLKTEFPEPLIRIKEELFRTGNWEGELTHYRKDGTKVIVASHWALYRDTDGRPIAVLESNNDITELKRAEAALRTVQRQLADYAQTLESRVSQRTAELERSVKEMEVFLYTIAHDLRAPLRAMRGFSQALISDVGAKFGEEALDYTRRIDQAGATMDELISDLLAFGQLSHLQAPTKSVSLIDEIKRVLQHVEPQIASRHAKVTIAEPISNVCGDSHVINQILESLISNALKFVPDERSPEIRISTEPEDGRVRLWVEDNGIGIEPQYQRKIFGPFQRLHRTHEYSGTGMGLAIVQKAVEKMGGRVGVESEIGRGSRFWVEFRSAGACGT